MQDLLVVALEIQASAAAALFATLVGRKALRLARRKARPRERLVKIAELVTGEAKARVAREYVAQGYFKADERALRRTGSVHAFRRCRALDLPLGDETWTRLFAHRSFEMRWAAMEHFIRLRGKNSVLEFLRFLARPDNHRKGAILHLLTCLARQDERILLVLLEYGEAEGLVELVLRALALYPAPGMYPAVLARVTAHAPAEILLAALDALTARPTPELTVYLGWLAEHSDWRIRERVARALGNYPSESSVNRLMRMSVDSQYDVRRAGARSMKRLGAVASSELRSIRADPGHPSYGFV